MLHNIPIKCKKAQGGIYILSTIIMIGVVIMAIGIGLWIGYNLSYSHSVDYDYSDSLDIVDYNECSNLTNTEMVYCLRAYVNTIYSYQVIDDFENRTLEDLILNGGDCYDWSNLYRDLSIELGYMATTTSIFNDDNSFGHRYVTIWDKELNGYCVIESTGGSLYCVEFEE